MKRTSLALAAILILAAISAPAPAGAALTKESPMQTAQMEETPADPGPVDQPEGEGEDFGGEGCGGGDLPDDVEAGPANPQQG